MEKENKIAIAAVLFFVAVTMLGGPANAQINLLEPLHHPDTNLLFATTGPNTIGAGKMQFSGDAHWHGFNINLEYPDGMHHSWYTHYGSNLGLRLGIGNRFELLAGLDVANSSFRYELSDTIFTGASFLLNPSAEVKFMLYEGGHVWVPQIAVTASLAVPFYGKVDAGFGNHAIGPVYAFGLKFRSRLSQRWLLDYAVRYNNKSLGLDGGHISQYYLSSWQYSIMARWLATNRLMIGFGLEDMGGRGEVMWQATENLQLRAQFNVTAGFSRTDGILESSALLGINWMLR